MRKILLIIKREYLTRVSTKGFIIGTVIVPLIGVGSICCSSYFWWATRPRKLRAS